MKAEPFRIVGLGELLWDLLPAGKQLGGAPANFAYITTLLGDEGIAASRQFCNFHQCFRSHILPSSNKPSTRYCVFTGMRLAG